jgi:hypothetical protein
MEPLSLGAVVGASPARSPWCLMPLFAGAHSNFPSTSLADPITSPVPVR